MFKLRLCRKCEHCHYYRSPLFDNEMDERFLQCEIVKQSDDMFSTSILAVKRGDKWKKYNDFILPKNCPYILEHSVL